MADNTATRKGGDINVATDGSGLVGSVKVLVSTIALATSADGDTIDFGKIPSNARILPQSTLYWDDLATTGSPTLDLGLKSYVNNSVTADPNALSDGNDVTSAGSAALTLLSLNTFGDPAWDFINGVTSDPGGELEVYGSIVDAATTDAGDVTLVLYYYTD